MGKTSGKSNKRSTKYRPFYPTTLGPLLHDVTFQKLPKYSLRPTLNPIDKRYSPGPAAYPGDHALVGRKKHQKVSKTTYPPDQAHIYSIGAVRKEFSIARTPGPAAYPFEEDGFNPLKVAPTIYPLDRGNIFSMRKKMDEKFFTPSPGPARYPRDGEREDAINSIHPPDLANKFSMVPFRDPIQKMQSPGPAVYPHIDTGDIEKIATIYPAETQLPPTFKRVYDIKDRDKKPGPNAYPLIEGKHDPKHFKVDFMKKMANGRKAPIYSLGIRHAPKQQHMVLPEDEYL